MKTGSFTEGGRLILGRYVTGSTVAIMFDCSNENSIKPIKLNKTPNTPHAKYLCTHMKFHDQL